ncbi:hypothetical protein [Neorhizobium galegae]|uniref:hypothetical protein n=1 Tax=Neorhizobium galegae TaxID=399 RepID=UPI002035BCA9|nr:hypothetical protein [Neorhizobium galegae]MCM2499300.1 hypothetical protein [Neorhizobium galegae]MCQ1772592.1 hypothetical protein [Neorhizobium galegae]MCQ1800287.1 hypothetical protein [Neorhizobium galegae]
MKSPNALPPQLALDAKARSDSSLAKVLAHRAALTTKFQAGKLTPDEVKALGLAKFCRQAGVGENFLNGDKYRDDVKPEIKKFLRDLKKLAKNGSADLENAGGANDGNDLELRFSRVCDLLHEARLTLHSKRQIIRTLSSGAGPTVVSISGNKSP